LNLINNCNRNIIIDYNDATISNPYLYHYVKDISIEPYSSTREKCYIDSEASITKKLYEELIKTVDTNAILKAFMENNGS
jgi:hypothetical protein